ncbi:QueT transporter family protein [bacterium]|nr:QueT transporter family protein [bacterium]MDY3023210.1 QueT transporter family protein [Oliverpabstia sp.]
MVNKDMSKVQKLTLSAMIIALYVTVMYCTQSFSFGAYQIRIATSMYALSYLFPFLVLPLGLANFIANMLFGGLGLLDMVGGCLVGIVTSSLIVGIRKLHWNRLLIILPIVLIPGLGVSTWLSYLLQMPYPALALSLCIGQIVPAICGVLLIQVLERVTGKTHKNNIRRQKV